MQESLPVEGAIRPIDCVRFEIIEVLDGQLANGLGGAAGPMMVSRLSVTNHTERDGIVDSQKTKSKIVQRRTRAILARVFLCWQTDDSLHRATALPNKNRPR